MALRINALSDEFFRVWGELMGIRSGEYALERGLIIHLGRMSMENEFELVFDGLDWEGCP